MVASNLSANTVASYLTIAGDSSDFLDRQDRHRSPQGITRADLDAYFVELTTRPARSRSGLLSEATVAKHYRSLQQLCRWLVKVEEEIEFSPMANMRPPRVGQKAVPVIPKPDCDALLATCSETSFGRDLVLIHLFFDTGVRCREMAGMTLDDIGTQMSVIRVVGKGNKERNAVYGQTSGEMLRRYLRRRRNHPHAGDPGLWIGRAGRMTESGLADIIECRCHEAGIGHINPHRFRHTFAHGFLAGAARRAT